MESSHLSRGAQQGAGSRKTPADLSQRDKGIVGGHGGGGHQALPAGVSTKGRRLEAVTSGIPTPNQAVYLLHQNARPCFCLNSRITERTHRK